MRVVSFLSSDSRQQSASLFPKCWTIPLSLLVAIFQNVHFICHSMSPFFYLLGSHRFNFITVWPSVCPLDCHRLETSFTVIQLFPCLYRNMMKQFTTRVKNKTNSWKAAQGNKQLASWSSSVLQLQQWWKVLMYNDMRVRGATDMVFETSDELKQSRHRRKPRKQKKCPIKKYLVSAVIEPQSSCKCMRECLWRLPKGRQICWQVTESSAIDSPLAAVNWEKIAAFSTMVLAVFVFSQGYSE